MFGTGKLSLNDPDETEDAEKPFENNSGDDDGNIEGKSVRSKKPTTKGYGSIDTTSPPNRDSFWTIPTAATSPVAKNDDEDSDDGDDDDDDVHEDTNEDFSSTNPESANDDFSKDTHQKYGPPDRPGRSCTVKVFSAISTFALITHLTLIVTQVVPMFWVPLDENDWSFTALKIYLCIFAVIFMIVEVDHPRLPLFRNASFLTTFVTRGFFYTFLGLICFENAYSQKAHEMIYVNVQNFKMFDVSWFALGNIIVAWLYISLGILYFLMGILCLQRLRNRAFQRERKKSKKYREAVDRWNREGV